MGELRTKLNRPQAEFIQLPQKFKAYVGGFGSGKTWVGCTNMARLFYEQPKVNQGCFEPSYPHIRDIFYPTFEEVAYNMGLNIKIKHGDKEVGVYSGSRYRGTVICRSMDRPETIVGFKIGHALVDELDVLPVKKAELAWNKVIARMRYQEARNTVDVTTTPEGFKFVYKKFSKAVRENPELSELYGLVQASTLENAKNLPPDYIPSLRQSYTAQLIDAYLGGQFVNLTSGTIYNQFDAKLNRCDDVIEGYEPLYIGMDFNVGHMSAVVHVKRDGKPRAVEEVVDAYDTPDMISILKERYCQEKRTMLIYPDASGGSRKSNQASLTDIGQLKDAGFQVRAKKKNPFVKDRINSMNMMFCNSQGGRQYKVNIDKCPVYTECLEQQVWDKNGEPDKKNNKDHLNDAAGYFIEHEYGINKPTLTEIQQQW